MGFIDKLKEQASSLGSQIDQALDGTKQKSQLSAMHKQRGEMMARLGEALLEQFRQQQVDAEQLRPQVEQIFDLEWQIIEAEKAVEAQRQAAAVPPPPATQAETEPPVPPAQDAPSALPEIPAAPHAAVCPSCSGDVPAGSAFCPNCGNAV